MRCTFANCYLNVDPHHIPPRRQSVTTVMTLSALGRVRGNDELADGKAVTHDITRWTMHKRGYEGPLIAPEEAGEHLLAVAEENDRAIQLFSSVAFETLGPHHSRYGAGQVAIRMRRVVDRGDCDPQRLA